MRPTFDSTTLLLREHKQTWVGSYSLLEAAMDRFMDRQHMGLYRRLRETPRADERRKILKLLAEKRAEFKLELQNVDLARGSRMECRPE